MRKIVLAITLLCLASAAFAAPESEPDVIYWDSDAGRALRARIPQDADYWQLIPTFAVQNTQSYCSVASAITVLNAMPIKKPVDPTYAPYAYFTQQNFFTDKVTHIISPETVLRIGMTREQMAETMTAQGVKARSIVGDTLNTESLRALLQNALGDDGQFVLANYLRASLGQVGGGHCFLSLILSASLS